MLVLVLAVLVSVFNMQSKCPLPVMPSFWLLDVVGRWYGPRYVSIRSFFSASVLLWIPCAVASSWCILFLVLLFCVVMSALRDP